MRVAVCGLAAILLSGCSWLGMGSGGSNNYNQTYGQYGSNCGNAGGGAYNMQSYGGACDGASMGGMGYGSAAGYGNGSNMGYGAGSNGFAGGYGGSTTTLGASAPYGAALAGANFGGAVAMTDACGASCYSVGQGYGGNVQTVQGDPIYVAQPYAVAHGGGHQGYQGGGALPFGLTGSIGTSVSVGGNIFPGEVAKSGVSELTPIEYSDAYKNSIDYGLGAEFDVNYNTTLLARVGYSAAESQGKFKVGTVTSGTTTEDLYAEFSDLEQYRVEGGMRRYLGGPNYNGRGMRSYVGATGGFVYTGDVQLTQSSATLIDPALFQQEYVDGGWAPTASGIIGAEWQTGPRTSIGIESGIRWTDNLDTNFKSDDRWTVPVQLRGRVAF